ncbi:hypothetical protein HJC23_009703 [Cyclotella cryptica]|uniref:Serine/threonine-protein kinase RIO1 n=1 Tax=Cyclotella cryptica TaxID=29204 RepID=A0ABD3Q860_9STRA
MQGQFDDAPEGDEAAAPMEIVSQQQSDDDFVASIRAKMMLLISNPAHSPTDDENCINSSHKTEPTQYVEDDDDDDDDMFDLLDDEDETLHNPSCKSSLKTNLASISSARINLDNKNMSHAVSNAVTKMQHLESSKRKSHTGRDDRATSEQCLDPRTRLILFRMLSNGFLELIDGCLSTGKEANVYYAKAGRYGGSSWMARSGGDGDGSVSGDSYSNVTFAPLLSADITEYAIKIYKTSILVFKDRDKYVSGEHRWRKGYCKSNPRKMVKVWAEKEMRNYRRIYNAGIPCPAPILLKSHVLIMEFLVHGDLSEYNLLWHKNEVYVIDVSQSVESDHPSALDFLRKDVSNVNDFFRKMANLNVMTTRQLFDFVTSTVIEDTPEAESAAIDAVMKCVDSNAMMMENATENERRAQHQQESVDEAVFMSQFLPRSLNQVADYEVGKIEEGDVEETYAQAVAALTGNEDVVIAASKKASVHVSFKPAVDDDDDDGEEEDGTSNCELENEESDGESRSDDDESNDCEETDQSFKQYMTPEERAAAKEAERALRKSNKKAVKEAQSEKRKNKIKKKEKQRAINKTKGNKKKK